MHKTSEWVSLGHPDKMADYISCFILDRFLEKDPMTRYALEVMIKDNIVTLGGEITSTAQYSAEDIAAFVRIAVNQIGYTRAYQLFWGEENTISGNNVLVAEHISQQSPDIAQGAGPFQSEKTENLPFKPTLATFLSAKNYYKFLI